MAETNSIIDKFNIGSKFFRWTVKSEVFTNIKNKSVICVCDCGNERPVRLGKLIGGYSRSCGCLRDEELTVHGHTKRRIRESSHEYWIWNSMLQRCTNVKNKQYPEYGGRGINVDEKWLTFEGFFEDMGFRPSKLHSIDRINNDLGYTKSNCEWRLRVEQNRNRRNNNVLTYNGMTLCISEWSEKTGISVSAIKTRIKNNWSYDLIFNTPVRAHKEYKSRL